MISYIQYTLSMMSLGKTPEVGLKGSEGSFQVKDALERPLRPLKSPWEVFSRGLSLGHH